MAATPGNAMNLNSTTSGLANWDGVATMSSTGLVLYNVLSGASTNTVNNIAPAGAGTVLTSNGVAAQPTFQALPFTKMPWTDKAISFNAAVQNGYFVTANATATLPGAPAQGDVISFAVDSLAGILIIQANTGQTIQIGKAISATAGTATSNFNGDSVTLVFRASDNNWMSVGGPQGTWTVL